MRNIDELHSEESAGQHSPLQQSREVPLLPAAALEPPPASGVAEAFGSGRGLASRYEAFTRGPQEKEKKHPDREKETNPSPDDRDSLGKKSASEKDLKDKDAPHNTDDPHDKQPQHPPLYKRPAVVITFLVILLILITVGTLWWLYARQYVTTDDAYVDGHVTQISPQISAPVAKLHIDDNQLVKKDDLLLELDPTDFNVALEQARAAAESARGRLTQAQSQIAAAEATVAQNDAEINAAQVQLDNALRDLERYKNVDARARSQQQLDNADTAAKNAEALLAQARAKRSSAIASVAVAEASVKAAQGDLDKALADVHRAEVNLSYCKIFAPSDGRVTSRTVEIGNYVTPGQSLFSLVSPDVWVTANFKETQLKNMRLGQPVTITVDSFPGKKWNGHVDSIQAGTGARFSVLPAENATGNFVKIVQRVPVKILFDHGDNTDDSHLLSPGLSVYPKVKVR